MLVKGRGNYLSLRRMNNAAERIGQPVLGRRGAPRPAADHRLVEEDRRRLAQRTCRSSRGRACGTRCKATASNCLGRKCKTYKDCFYFRARRRVHNAQLLIVNHALFFSDLALRRIGASILPDYDAVIFDEAHTLEAVAGDHLGLGVTSGQVQYLLNKLYNDRTNKGLLVTRKLREAQDLVVECYHRADELFDDVVARRSLWQRPRSVRREPSTPGRIRRVHQTDAVENRLSPALTRLAKRDPAGGPRHRRRIGAARFHLGPRSADWPWPAS